MVEARTVAPSSIRSTPDARPSMVLSRVPSDFPLPEGREEEWRFTPIDRLRHLLDPSTPASGEVTTDCHAPDGILVTTVPTSDPRVGSACPPADRAAATALANAGEALLVEIPADHPGGTVTVSVKGSGGTAFRHLVVDAGRGATATVVVDHAGTATFSGGIEVLVGDDSVITLVSIQDWDPGTIHLAQHSAVVGRDARYRAVHVTFGGDLVRISPRVRYAGPGGDAELLGLYFADDGQHLEHRTHIHHAVERCRSRVSYRGALQGQGARTVWVGDVLIGPEAVRTDTYEVNRNLLLTDGARADSVPNLEILTGEVTRAGHATTTGRFDDEQLFYLESRGIPAEDARRLVVRAFFAELIDRIGVPALEERLTTAVEHELSRTVR